jgi:enamine deaminase RidA (YjgF/YER057c/UK114 family)
VNGTGLRLKLDTQRRTAKPANTTTHIPIKSLPQPPPTIPTQTDATPAHIRRERENGMDLVAVETPEIGEFHLTATPIRGEPLSAMIDRIAELLRLWEATVVRLIVFGPVREQATTVATLRQALKDPVLPVTWVEGASCDSGPVAGMQLHAVAGARVKTLRDGDHVLGRVWRDAVANHCVISGLGPKRTMLARPQQARETFENLQSALAMAGMNVKDVARTWLFLEDILSWYGDFNRVRTDFYAQAGLGPGSFPASTGVSGRNPAGGTLTAAAWAIQPLEQTFKPFGAVPSPRQCPAPAYGSSFSRAVEIVSAGFRQLLISGTASISPTGRTAHAGDVRGQIEVTMRAVGAILKSRGMSLPDISRATAYFKSASHLPVFEDWLNRRGLDTLPVLKTCGDICRDDLLFEIEVDAVQSGS